MNIKELKSIDISRLTIISTGIAVLFSVIVSIIIMLGIVTTSANNIKVLLYLIPTIIVTTFMISIYSNFLIGYLYNVLSKRLNNIKVEFNDKNEISKISTTSTATIIAIISTIYVILIYLASMFILPLMINSIMQTLLYSGQTMLAYSMYSVLLIVNNPLTVAYMILGTFIITFVFTLLGTYIYNILASKGRGVLLTLSEENGITTIESISVLKLAIVFSIIYGILNVILAIIMIISGGATNIAIGTIIGGFVNGFIDSALVAIFYNFLAPRLGKLKIELINQ
ncbi:hypothetical protein [Methanobrevibacter oralis]|uniref:hypothetical protein n=1 Tax=Methanobrevibacter oralis TaxID=66851 RepID=UPI001C7386AA|nr:hypothetical protein [Methanobrevibacter oralis]